MTIVSIDISIDNDLCVGCRLCVLVCKPMVLGMAGEYVATVVDASKCNLCMDCEEQCPESAIKVQKN